MHDAPNGPPVKADELIAACRAALLSCLEETCRAIRMSDESWLERVGQAAGQRFDELVGIRDRRGFEMARGLTASRISLIHEEDLDFSIELTELARHLHDGLDDELVRLGQRMRVLLKQSDTAPEQLPPGPETACEGLRALAEAASLDPEARMTLLERARQPLEERLRALYVSLNQRLDEAGIKARVSAPRRSVESGGPGTAGATALQDAASAQATPLGRMQQALLARMPTAQPASAGGGDTDSRLAAALERIEAWLETARPSGAPAGAGTLGLRELMPLLPARKACALEAVEQLFVTIAQDADLPLAIRQVLEKLHTPLLRQALHNDRLFEDPDSMALALLDRLAGVGYDLPATVTGDDARVRALDAIVASVQASSDADEIVCSKALGEVAGIADEQHRHLLALGVPYHDLTSRAERKELALQAASKAIRALMQSDTHVAVRQLLETYWIHLLAQAALRHGAKDTSWRERLETANQLIRSVPPHPSPATRQELIRMLPGLIGQLRAGLAQLGLDEHKTTLALTPCMNLHSAIIAGRPMPEASWKSPQRTATLGKGKEPGALPALQHGGYPADEPRISPELQGLAVGAHLHAALPDGATFDGVLVWRSPRAQMLLLANPRSGACMAMSLRAAAELAASGKLTLGRATLAERTAERVLARESGA